MNSPRTPGHRTVWVSLYVSVAETTALAVAAAFTGSAALKTQTATSLADVAGAVFLLIGVISSGREPTTSTRSATAGSGSSGRS